MTEENQSKEKLESPYYVQKEEEILKYWEENNLFQKSIEQNKDNEPYVFYDGPPFATGLPHYGHILASTMKDVVPRYWTMRGYKVERKWGWDCHGLPIENIVEKELNLKNKADIDKLGIDTFNETCRSKVQMYAFDWKKIIPRLGRWVDMENDYKTMDDDFMESVWWVFKTLWEKDLIYEGYKSMHICPRCETTLSNFEVNLNYKDTKDITATVKFKLLDEEDNTYVLAWTTTPWTLPGNVALAVGADIEYAKVQVNDENYIVAKDLVENIFANEDYEILDTFKGIDLEEKKYQPLFDYFLDNPVVNGQEIKNKENLYKIVTADFVATDEGTGIVHIAPAFGEEDMNLGKEKNLAFIQHVKMNGEIVEEVKDFAGLLVKTKEDPQATDKKIIDYLEGKGLLFKAEEHEHSYPFCWRCDTPLLNYATTSWFVDVPKFRDKLIENNRKINWVPEHFKDGRFGKWLENVREWAISRDRFWGNPLPIWKCDSCDNIEVLGSIKELEEKTGEEHIEDLHKHKIDKYTWKCEKCGGTMRRIPEVLDCWFESGAMPYASNHYPFENKEKFEKEFPAQFIAEGQDQTRGWFYTLLVLSTALFDKPAFENVVVNGIVLAEDGKKMSKRLKNYPDPMDVIHKYGADALRMYLMSSPVVKAEDLRFSEDAVKEIYRKVVVMLWNIYAFYKMYYQGEYKELNEFEVKNILDKWILSKLKETKNKIDNSLENYDLMSPARYLMDFINEFSTWYIRRSRDRFKLLEGEEKLEAISVLRYVLLNFVKLLAPYAPFLAEGIYLELSNGELKESVHLEAWPELSEIEINQDVLSKMELSREIVEDALAIRSENSIKIRQALSEAEIKENLEVDYLKILEDELNIKEIKIVENFSEGENWKLNDKINVNIKITDDLRKEGLAREMVRFINIARKKAKLTIDDLAVVKYWTNDDFLKQAISENVDYIKMNTKSKDLLEDEAVQNNGEKVKLNGIELYFVLEK